MNVCLADCKPSLAVDIDGVLTDFSDCGRCDHADLDNRKYHLCPTRRGVAAHMRKLKAKFRIILYTARGEGNREVTEDWLHRHRIPYDDLVMDKPYAAYYIDDRAIEFRNWSDTVSAIL